MGIEKIIEKRIGHKTMGFGADIKSNEKKDVGEILKSILPEDLLKYGLIPEMAGRLPVIVTLHSLDEEALVQILTEPKNSLTKQYQALFAMDGVDLEFEPGALQAIAKEAIDRKTGARGLRALLENTMLDVMYEIPSRDDVKKCIINKKCIEKHEPPKLVTMQSISSNRTKKQEIQFDEKTDDQVS